MAAGLAYIGTTTPVVNRRVILGVMRGFALFDFHSALLPLIRRGALDVRTLFARCPVVNNVFDNGVSLCHNGPMTKLQRIAARLIDQHKGLRRAARAVGIDHAYLYRLRHGLLTDPGDEILAKLGIRRKVTYLEMDLRK